MCGTRTAASILTLIVNVVMLAIHTVYLVIWQNTSTRTITNIMYPTQLAKMTFDEILDLIPVTMEARCFHEQLEFQSYPPKDFCTARYERKSSKKKFQTRKKKTEKKNSLADLGPRKTQPNVCSKRRDSESWTDIDRQNQRLCHEI